MSRKRINSNKHNLMSKPTSQHYVPQCYLREFADPKISPKKEPFIWIFDKNGNNRRRDKIRNVLSSNDLYTLKSNGSKDYSIEDFLANLEGKYAAVFRNKIKNKLPINEEEHIVLCAFVCAMLNRTLRQKDNLEQFVNELIERTEAMEKAHNAKSKTSYELKDTKKDIHKLNIIQSLPEITKLLVRMNIAFLCAEKGSYFITSDDPCNMFNPDVQDSWIGPGLEQKNIQVTLPLSPEITLCLSWSNMRGYIHWDKSHVDEVNRMLLGHCYNYFVSHRNRTKRMWFRKYPLDLSFILKIIKKRIVRLYFKLKNRIEGY